MKIKQRKRAIVINKFA